MENEMKQAETTKKRKPISDSELNEILTEIKKKAKRDDHMYIIKADLVYGLSKEDVEVYAYLNSKNKKMLEFLSKILRKRNGRPLAEYFAANSFSMEQMEIIERFYFKGVSLEDISEVLEENQTAFSLDDALENVYEQLYASSEKSQDEAKDIQQKHDQILEAVSKISEDYALLTSIQEAVEKSLTKEDVDAIREEYVKQLSAQESAIEDLRKRNESLARENAVLRQSKEDVRVITDEIADLKVQVKTLEQERDEAISKVEEHRREKEGMEGQVDSLRDEMDAVKFQLEQAKENPKPSESKESNRVAAEHDPARQKVTRSDYQVVIGNSAVAMEQMKAKSPESIVAKAGRILKGIGKANVLHTMADAGLNSEQMAILANAKKKGLTDAELIDIINCGFDTDEMEQAIDIVLMEKNY